MQRADVDLVRLGEASSHRTHTEATVAGPICCGCDDLLPRAHGRHCLGRSRLLPGGHDAPDRRFRLDGLTRACIGGRLLWRCCLRRRLHVHRGSDFSRVLIFLSQDRDHGPDLDGDSLINEDLGDRPVVVDLHLHRGLVGLDVGHRITGGDGVAFLGVPLDDRALLHRVRKAGHGDLDRHDVTLIGVRRLSAATIGVRRYT